MTTKSPPAAALALLARPPTLAVSRPKATPRGDVETTDEAVEARIPFADRLLWLLIFLGVLANVVIDLYRAARGH